jgi:biotin operon repressor
MPHDSENIRRSKESLRKPRPKSDLSVDEPASHDEGRSRNTRTGRSRIPWSALDDPKKQIRYAQALRAFDNGVRKSHPGTFNEFAAAQSALDAHQKPALSKTSKQTSSVRANSHVPHLFGRGGVERVLTCLAVNGPMHVRQIARTIGSDSHKVWNMVESLREINVVVKREQGGGRKYAALNRDLPIYRPLYRLLIAMDKYWPVPRIDRQTARWRMPFNDDMEQKLFDELFQGQVRSRVLLLIAAIGLTDQKNIYNLLGLGTVSTLYAVNHWERQGVLKSIYVKSSRLVTLNREFECAAELKTLLLEMVKHSGELLALRKIGRKRMRKFKLT